MMQPRLEANRLKPLDRILKTDDEAECLLLLFNRQAQAGPTSMAAPQAVPLEALVTGILVDVKSGMIARYMSDEVARLKSLWGLEAPLFPFEAPQLRL